MTEFNNPNFSIDLSDQVALVTGASSGLGYRFSKVLAKCGAKVALSGKWLNSCHYEVDKVTGLIDYEQVEKIAIEKKPKLIIAGGSAYSRIIDFKKFREISDKVTSISEPNCSTSFSLNTENKTFADLSFFLF